MKKIALIILVTVFSKNIHAQVPDTLVYLQSIVANKANYIGQPFSVLKNNLQIEIKYFSPFGAIHQDKNKETSTSFAFYFPQTADEMYLTFPKLEIYWQPYLNASQSDILFGNNGGGWDIGVYNFYANGIITDIKVRD